MKRFKWLLLGGCALATVCLAEVPVEDLTQQDSVRPRSTRSSSAALPSPVEQNSEEEISVESSPKKSPAPKSSSGSSLSAEKRLEILERKIENMINLDPLGQINKLQTDVDRLRGQLEVQEHANKQLTEQLKAQYKDLSQRTDKITAAKDSSSKASVTEKTKDEEKVKDKDKDKTNPKVESPTKETLVKDSKDKTPGTEKEGYDSAITLLKKRDYVQATTGLQRYLRDYPNGQYAASAHYWLGEIYSYQGQPDLAIAEYKTVITQYSSDDKVPDALLKLGIAYDDAGDQDKAREQFEAVATRFPNTETAQLANARLKKMKKGVSKEKQIATADDIPVE